MVRMIASIYYPLKFAVVWFWFFGWTSCPFEFSNRVVMRLGNFNEVWSAIQNFSMPFVEGFTLWSLVFFLVMLVPYIAILIWSLRYPIIFVFALLPLLRYLVISARSRFHYKRVKLDKQVQIHNGAPGTGKTRLLVILADILAGLMWKKLSWLHWRDYKKKRRTDTEQEDWDEIAESYQYYTTKQNGRRPIKCLFSNIGIEKSGSWSSKLTFEHAAQLERVPSYTISLFSEFGTTYNIEYSHEKLLQMSDDLRFCRQFRENIILGDEQDASNVSIDARRVVSDVWLMTECRHILQPTLLNIPFKILKSFFIHTQAFKFRLLGAFMTKWEQLINQIGFVRFRYVRQGNTEHMRTNNRGVFIARTCNPVRYDTRAFRKLADCRLKPAKGELHTTLEVENSPQIRQAYLRAEFKNRPDVFYTNRNEIELENLESEFWQRQIFTDKLRRWRREYPDKYDEFRSIHRLGSSSSCGGNAPPRDCPAGAKTSG